jgi:hypothetical protein
MANKRSRKAWTSVERRRKVERLMCDTEVFTATELQERKKRIATIMRMEDKKLQQEQQSIQALGVCTFCNCVLTTTGECMMSCR